VDRGSAQADRTLDIERWGQLAEDEPGELVRGHLEEEEMPTRVHEAVVAWLLFELTRWARARGAKVYPSELKLAIDADEGRKPDISVYLAGTPRSPATEPVQLLPPDVAVEVISSRPSDARRDRIDKSDAYARANVRFYWIVDPQLRGFEIYELGTDGRYVRADAATVGTLRPRALADLELDLDALWAEVDAELESALTTPDTDR
jgi:Uma2 family endonuclease